VHPEAITLSAEGQVGMQQQPDMAEFEAEFAQQAETMHPGHGPECECDHHHADAHIDHPEDHLHKPAEVHAAPHVHESHHEPHDHDSHRERAEVHQDHNEHESHVHGPGCGHVEHERAHEYIDHHVHDERCGHLHHGEAKEHVDKPHIHDANCGHLHRHEAEAHVDHAQKLQREAAQAQPPGHDTEAVHAHQHENEAIRQQQVVEVAEPLVSDVTRVAERPLTENEVRATESSEAVPAPTERDPVANPIQETGIAERLDDVSELYEMPIVSEEQKQRTEPHSELTLDTETIAANTELIVADMAESETTTSYLAEVEAVDVVEAPAIVADELFTAVDIIRETPEAETITVSPAEQVLPALQEAVTAEMPKPEWPAAEKKIPDFATIEEQFRVLEETIGSRRPEVLNELHKSIANLYAALHDGAGEADTVKVSQELLKLFTLLGFEQPDETLQVYLRAYGTSVMSDMLIRLFELLWRSRSVGVASAVPSFSLLSLDSNGIRSIGKAVLVLLQLGRYCSISIQP
jgi:hypothetical protein